MAARGSAAWDGGFVPSSNCRAVLSRDSATVRDGPASSQGGTFLAQDSAMSSASRRAGPGADGVSAAANPRADSAPTAGVGPQSGSTRNGRSLRLRRRVAAQHVALATQHGTATFASDAQSSTARTGSAGLTTDSDTP